MPGALKKTLDHCRISSGGDYSFSDGVWFRPDCAWPPEEAARRLAAASPAKLGSSVTACVDGKYFYKRYNPRGWFYNLKRRLQTPRPWRCLAAAAVLTRGGIATPEVVWASRSLLVTRALPPEARTLDKARPLPGAELAAFLARIHAAGVYHGDMSLRNIYRAGDDFGVIDLDAARLDGPTPQEKRRDLARLISSWLRTAGEEGWRLPDRAGIIACFEEHYRRAGGAALAGKALSRRVDYLAGRVRRNWKKPRSI